MELRFEVRERRRTVSEAPEYLVVDTEDEQRPVAAFADPDAAAAHADKLNAGPLDWDEQEQWQDPWDEDDRGD